jgi:CheY-like chemotaxis protein
VNFGMFFIDVPIEGAQSRLMSQTRVLCVENHPEYLGALKSVLETAGYEVMAATNGDQALRLVTTLDVDAVLLEYDLPDAAGTAVRAEMKRIKPGVPVLLFAGIGSQTPFLLRFLDAYLQSPARLEPDRRVYGSRRGDELEIRKALNDVAGQRSPLAHDTDDIKRQQPLNHGVRIGDVVVKYGDVRSIAERRPVGALQRHILVIVENSDLILLHRHPSRGD